ncbi:hypothetical protein B5M09_006019 [Aphanomyces astaci]|uniref:Major facilitator superfamily (MFS) profile domain-containing protein n=1 Tax=Aphanomyces astaci TaxID=112090 RepID=A0A3R7Z9E7_APHAT|nr:hypothetical protein B5M09_006019 [Aphanomyces astaci]
MLQQFCGINTVMYYGVTIIRLAGFTDSHVAIWLGAVVALSNFLFTFVGIYLVDRYYPRCSPMPWTINAEIYPLSVRSTAISLATAVNWISNLVVSLTFLSLIQATSTYATFWLYGAVATVGFVYLVYHLPETKGLTLEEIDGVFQVRGGVTYEPVATDRTL